VPVSLRPQWWQSRHRAAPLRFIDIGEKMSVGDANSEVVLFTHADSEAVFPFIRPITASGHMIAVSAGHYICENGALEPTRCALGSRVRFSF
jgi:hypothetical protein